MLPSQTLRALKYIHSANVLHRDLKPSNLLVNSNCDLKICDFGLARPVEVNSGPLTEYVVTRWYRAPEIMLSCQEYTKAIDVWSVGCIFAELLKRTPLFPGEDYMHQLRLICELLGKPKAEDLDFVNTERARKYMMSLEEPARPKIETYFRGHNPDALDLLEKMLKFHPAQRITVDEVSIGCNQRSRGSPALILPHAHLLDVPHAGACASLHGKSPQRGRRTRSKLPLQL